MQNLLTFFSKNISIYAIFNGQSFNDTLTNDIVSFEQLGPDILSFLHKTYFVATHSKHLSEMLLMSTHNICSCEEKRKNIVDTSTPSYETMYLIQKSAF